MTEKLCPMRKSTFTNEESEQIEVFLPCIKENCAWWEHSKYDSSKGNCVIINLMNINAMQLKLHGIFIRALYIGFLNISRYGRILADIYFLPKLILTKRLSGTILYIERYQMET
jgi:hypothetical protein